MNKRWYLAWANSTKSIRRHIFLWLGFYVAFTLLMSFQGNLGLYALMDILNVSLYILVYYPLRYFLIPTFYKKDKKILFVFSVLMHILFAYLVYWGIRLTFLDNIAKSLPPLPFKHPAEFMVKTLRFFSPAILLLVWEYQFKRKQHLNRIRSLEKEKLATELKFLKAQINPHFLFNTLNNLYSFVVRESPKAPDMISRLTGILDYVFNQSQQNKVPLKSELSTIEDYLELEKIRYGDRLKVEYATEGQLNQEISPLILLSIIENAFKHGASGDIDEPKVHININASKAEINCNVWNTKSRHRGELNDAYKKGIGLSNIRRQLNLIYPNQHELIIDDQEKSFNLSLTINSAA